VRHVVLLGDSIFDNEAYVAPGPAVIEQLRARLPDGDHATLIAVDGHVAADVHERQLPQLPDDATHLVLSVGGNDALMQASVLAEPARTVGEAVERLFGVRARFARVYQAMVAALARRKLPTAVCTIYDPAYPEPYRSLVVAALCLFNDVIVRTAIAHRLAIVDLRAVCCEPRDFANPIEPSSQGGAKIAAAVTGFLDDDAAFRRSSAWA
jgi:lysophospholipase L1-like esterase